LKELLDEVGLGGERLEMYFISSSEGQRFAEAVEEMTRRVQEMGPNPLRGGPESGEAQVVEEAEG